MGAHDARIQQDETGMEPSISTRPIGKVISPVQETVNDTPVLDIKPYYPVYDRVEQAVTPP